MSSAAHLLDRRTIFHHDRDRPWNGCGTITSDGSIILGANCDWPLTEPLAQRWTSRPVLPQRAASCAAQAICAAHRIACTMLASEARPVPATSKAVP